MSIAYHQGLGPGDQLQHLLWDFDQLWTSAVTTTWVITKIKSGRSWWGGVMERVEWKTKSLCDYISLYIWIKLSKIKGKIQRCVISSSSSNIGHIAENWALALKSTNLVFGVISIFFYFFPWTKMLAFTSSWCVRQILGNTLIDSEVQSMKQV